MRLHGIHLQGLRSPSGIYRLVFDPGYNLLACRDPEARDDLLALLRGMLYPGSDLGSYLDWRDPDAAQPPRAALSISFGSQAFRVVVDFANERMVLGCYEPQTETYRRLSTDPAEIAELLNEAGLPTREQWLRICAFDGPDEKPEQPLAAELARSTPPGVVPEPLADPAADRQDRERTLQRLEDWERARRALEEEIGEAERAKSEREANEERVRELRAGRDRLREAERERDAARRQLEESAAIPEGVEDAEVQLARYRELAEKRDEDQTGIERSRQSLLEQRASLRVVPRAQLSWMWLGVALGVAGATAGFTVADWFGLIGLAGAGLAVFALLVSRNARRRIGAIEARLAALRVRERAIQRHFDTECAPVRNALRSLGLETIEELEAEVARRDSSSERVEVDPRQLDAARGAYPEGAEEELRELEAGLSEGPAPNPDEVRARLVALGPAPPEPEEEEDSTATRPEILAPGHVSPPLRPAPVAARPGDDPDALIALASAWSARPAGEVRSALAAPLVLHLRGLTGGVVSSVEPAADGPLRFRRGDSGWVAAFAELPAELQAQVLLAFRFALVEALAASRHATLLVGDLSPSGADASSTARALARLGSITQVLQVACEPGDWSERAARVHTLA
jgi:hypothetical protein